MLLPLAVAVRLVGALQGATEVSVKLLFHEDPSLVAVAWMLKTWLLGVLEAAFTVKALFTVAVPPLAAIGPKLAVPLMMLR